MALWSYTKPPEHSQNQPESETPLVDDSGWLSPNNKEILVAIQSLHKKRQKTLSSKLNQFILEDGTGFFILEDSSDLPIDVINPKYHLNENSVLYPDQVDIDNLPDHYSEDPEVENLILLNKQHKHS